ncbi:hypothetical protein ABZ816_12165 [Actinosynnema sp. NPDC047251]|uniref:Heparin-binding hemagglutinin n=1 Tax=Saccharothrix espanaensis (strain ATCC 51144 / DSM 44229 / JCM 9112 / NBRC 15066 / NRRL 15764) TaxID=1179773 RepID=K0KEZ5_SACES|nr:hypothetical protein [Saccharothrix espanaensis]CCH35354.1 hypothetical protein BN6_81370 [Saccharothrix espanaensis DSM 44229]
MSNLPTTEELRKAGEQVVAAARTPLLAALGAGDLAAKAVIDALNKTKERAEAAKTAAESADLQDLRDKFEPAELRKIVDAYTQSALNLYQYLAEHGQEALDRLKSQPQVQKALSEVEAAVETAQKRTGAAASDARDLADDVLGKVTRRTRSVGEKVAREVDETSEKLASAVTEAGDDVAHDVRSTARKAANRTASARSTAAAPKTTAARKPAAARPTTPKKAGDTAG